MRARSVVRLISVSASALGATARAQTGTVTGSVAAEGSRRPVASAQIAVLGQPGRGAVSDASGQFRIAGLTGPTAILNTRMVGYRARTDTVRVGTTGVTIVLSELPSALSEVVITGTPGGQARRELGSSVASISLSDQVATTPAVSLGQELNARAPGINVTPASGQAGAGQRIQLRGRTSLTLRTEPILMVDGVRTSAVSALNDFDANEFDNVEIVMGPSAATLYGTDASAGVVQLRTKRGRPGAARVSVQVRSGFSYFNDYLTRFPLNHYFDENGNVQDFNLPLQEKNRGTPLYKTALNQGYELDVSGGSDAVQYYAALHSTDDAGIVPKNRNRTYGGRLSLNISSHQKWDGETQLGFTLVRTQLPYGFYTANALLSNPSQRNAPSRGFLFGVPNDVESRVTENSNNVDHLTAGAEVRYRVVPWLTQRLRGGVDIANAKGTSLTKRMTPEDAVFFTPTAAAGSESVTNTDVLSTTLDYGATAVRDVSRAFKLTVSGGAQYYRSFTQILNANGRTFPTPDVTTLAGAATTFGTNSSTDQITVGAYTQAQVGVNDRLYLTGALRADGASNFGKSFGLAKYPKVSVSWVISEEPFFKLRYLDELRLRSAYGIAGQQPVAFAALRAFTPITGPAGNSAVTPNLIGNEFLGPERAREFEAGFDATMFQQWLTLGFTFYDQRTTDAIIRRDVAPSSGFPAQQFVNAGALHNVGWELQASATPVRRAKLRWDIGAGLSTNENTVTAINLPGVPFVQFGTGSRFEVGFPAYGIFARRIISADRGPNNTAINVLCDGGVNDRPGGMGVPCATAPRVYLGRTDPKWMGQFSSSVRVWDRLTVAGLADFRAGYIKFVDFLYCGGGLGMGGGCQSRWYPERYSPIIVAYNAFNSTDMAAWYTKGDFFRLREVSVSYMLPSGLARRVGASSALVSVAGRNLGTWYAAGKSASSLDPESSTYPDGGTGQAIEGYPIPQLRFFTLLLNLKY